MKATVDNGEAHPRPANAIPLLGSQRQPTARPVHRATGASLVVIIGVAVSIGGVMVLHAVRADLDPLREVMSHYANGSQGRIMSAVFYAFGTAALALGFRLRPAMDRSGVTKLFPALLALAGVGLLAAGVFEVDRPLAPQTTAELIHSNSAVAAFAMLIVAMLLFSLACRNDDRWWSFRWTSVTLAAVAAVAAAGTQLAGGSPWSGAVQRVLAGAVLAWFLLTALHVRRKAFREPCRSTGDFAATMTVRRCSRTGACIDHPAVGP